MEGGDSFFGERTHWREEREKGVFFGGRRRGSTEVIFWKGGALCRERKKLQPHGGGNTYTGLPSTGESRGNSHLGEENHQPVERRFLAESSPHIKSSSPRAASIISPRICSSSKRLHIRFRSVILHCKCHGCTLRHTSRTSPEAPSTRTST